MADHHQPIRVFIPRDTTSHALGAEAVMMRLQQEAQQRGLTVEIVRNGSRGLCWLEPLLEVECDQGRQAYGPVTAADIPALLESGMLYGQQRHPLALGDVSEIPWLKRQQRLTFARAGVIEATSIRDYRAHGGFAGLNRALALRPQAIVDEVKHSGLRGRGGAAFPTGIKWQTVLDCDAGQKYIVCNADEGDSGTFADRLVMEADPLMLIEGMVIAGLAVGADQGYIYLRQEYPLAHQILEEAIEQARAANWLGDNIQGSGQHFHLEVRLGAASYVCGEETALLNSLEGRRGQVRSKPPLPAIEGLFGQPTIVNNVLTLAAIPFILAEGGQAYADYGMGRSRGTLPFQLAGNIRRGGLVELAFGTTLRTLVDDFGQGSASDRPLRAIQIGGPLGAYLPEPLWDTPLDYEAFSEIGAGLGHGGIVAFDDSVDMARQAHFAMAFCVAESCGKCTPCRIGSTRGVEVIERIQRDENRAFNLELLDDLCDTMTHGSLCAMGGMTPIPVQSALRHFPEDFNAPAREATP